MGNKIFYQHSDKELFMFPERIFKEGILSASHSYKYRFLRNYTYNIILIFLTTHLLNVLIHQYYACLFCHKR